MTTEERLEKLENELASAKRRVRRLVVAGAGVLACFGAFVAAWASMRVAHAQGQAQVLQAVQAQSFVVVDKNGKTRAWLGWDKTGTRLVLYDENDNLRAHLGTDKSGTMLSLNDETGHLGAHLYALMESGPGLSLSDKNGQSRAALGTDKDGPNLTLMDEKGTPRAVLAVSMERPNLALLAENGSPLALLAVNMERPNLTLLDLLDENANLSVGLSGTGKDASGLTFWDKKGKVLFRAP